MCLRLAEMSDCRSNPNTSIFLLFFPQIFWITYFGHVYFSKENDEQIISEPWILGLTLGNSKSRHKLLITLSPKYQIWEGDQQIKYS